MGFKIADRVVERREMFTKTQITFTKQPKLWNDKQATCKVW